MVNKMFDPKVLPLFPGDKLSDGLQRWRGRTDADPAPLAIFAAVRASCLQCRGVPCASMGLLVLERADHALASTPALSPDIHLPTHVAGLDPICRAPPASQAPW